MSWCQRFVGKVNDPLRVRFFIGRTLGRPTRGVEEVLPSPEVVLTSWEDWVDLCLGGHLLPCLKDLVGLLPWLAWVDLREWDEDELLPSPEGRGTVTWEELWELLVGGRAVAWVEASSFPGKDSSCQRGASFSGRESTCLGRNASFPGSDSSCWRGSSFSRRESICLGRNASFPRSDMSYWRGASVSGRESICLGRNASFPGSDRSYRRGASFSGRESTCLGRNASIPSRGGFTWEVDWLTWLPACVIKLFVLVLLGLVIFPSFLIVSKLNLFGCLCLTLLNLGSPTLSTKSWHSLKSLCWDNRC